MKVQHLVALLFFALALSGCTSEAEDPDTMPHDEMAHDDTNSMPENATLNETGPADPADAFVTLAADVLGGDSPITVTFELDGQKNETIGYTLAFGDGEFMNGTTADFPLTISHEFLYAGEYEAMLTGEYVDEFGEFYQTASVSLTLTGAAPPPESGVKLGTASFNDGGTMTLGIQGANSNGDVTCSLDPPANTLNEAVHNVEIPDNYFGVSSYVSKFSVQFTNGETAIDIDVQLIDPDGAVIASSAGFEIIDGEEKMTAEGVFLAGIYQVQVTSCMAVEGEYSFVMDATFNAQ